MSRRTSLFICIGIAVLFTWPLIPTMTVEAYPCLRADQMASGTPFHYEYTSTYGIETCEPIGMETVPGQSVTALHWECEIPGDRIWDAWDDIVGNEFGWKWRRYRSCVSTDDPPCLDYYPPIINFDFPLCDGKQWTAVLNPLCPDGECKATATYVGSWTGPAGTFNDCYELSFINASGRWIQCPCMGGVEGIDAYPTGVVGKLQSYNRCSGLGMDDDADGDGYLATECLATRTCGGDCDDGDSAINPGAVEICNDGIDNDCDGLTDGDDPPCIPGCVDGDGDGYFVGGASCGPVDCDDDSSDDPLGCGTCSCGETGCVACAKCVNPGAIEVCDGFDIDNNCNGTADNVDWDEDGYIAEECGGTDCIDYHAGVNPDGSEICDNRLDDDCDGLVDCDDPDCPSPPCPWKTSSTMAAPYGVSSAIGSGILNHLVLVLVPIGAVIFLRIFRKRR